MGNSVAIIISPNYKDYAEKYLAECLSSLRQLKYDGVIKFFIIDNETSEGSRAILKKILDEEMITPQPLLRRGAKDEVKIILNKNNDGFAKGNNDAMRLAIAQGYEYIYLLNMDTVVEADCVSEMVKVFYNNDNTPTPLAKRGYEIGAVQARLMLWPEKDKINSLGNNTHFLGFGFGSEYNQIFQNSKFKIQNLTNIFYPSGAAVMFKAEVLKEIGLFDEEYWMYNEDQDLGWRVWLAGYRNVLAPEAIVYHKYQFSKSIKQYYWMDRNRIINILKYYHIMTLLLIFPAFIIMEAGLILFSIKTGWFREKIRMWAYFLTPKTWAYLLRARNNTQKLRKVKDKDIVPMLSGRILHQEVDGDAKLKFINPIFDWYWGVVKKIIWW
jgi:GT2 family glycosyltransferase